MRREHLLAWSLLVILALNGLGACGKVLEGFGDELEEEGDDDIQEAQPAYEPKKTASTSSAGGQEGLASEGEAGQDAETKPDPHSAKQTSGVGPGKLSFREEWDDEEFEGVPVVPPERVISDPLKSAGTKPPGAKQAPRVTVKIQEPRKPLTLQDHIPEILFLVFLVVFGANYFLGSRTNEKIALAWAEHFTSSGSIFEKNFSLLGTGGSNDANEPLMVKEGQSIFKFYASGRRFCECVLVTLNLNSRHDLLSLVWSTFTSRQDTLKIEVHMNDDSMQSFILAVVKRKAAKTFLKEHKDLKEYCSILDFSSRKQWPVGELAVISDCREAANELLNDVILDQLLGEKAFDKFAAKHFISMHFTDQYPAVVKKKILTFEFALPPPSSMGDIVKLMAAVPYFIDAVAKVSLSAPAKAKAEAARTKAQAAALKELQEQKQEELQRRREERRRAEEAKMSPAELAKKKEKDRLKELKPRSRLTRIH